MKLTMDNIYMVCDKVMDTHIDTLEKWQNSDKIHTECYPEIDLLTAYKQAIKSIEEAEKLVEEAEKWIGEYH